MNARTLSWWPVIASAISVAVSGVGMSVQLSSLTHEVERMRSVVDSLPTRIALTEAAITEASRDRARLSLSIDRLDMRIRALEGKK